MIIFSLNKLIRVIVKDSWNRPECGEEVELDEFNAHVKNRHKGHLDNK